ncbi:MAG TPA: preprotein translocase subunit SecG [Candidatus Omnitrophica bacterium]|nr:MAG: preprotein translocase subunit SecG [Omnitrophica WOR_2 bacterium GWA2_63_20]OGX15952.1 MAG: preprotein translocase subunit SecG [Omnitrophica WOR_2 bacterium GWF2_63_9]OGX31508.1 MAG: preprotein translocase subunit SecG [Omnitrophica WOR_2 bacterium RIFCSPHIGHO2_12_FULL_64_13]OGX36608.1 MAG: preprotein translocase subunit SecG [Omnitrophica WOR_2 bacterium RIFCSPHIGHO2_02_FULL_63_39]OGX46360.1 MAG: preprotein translocase subunit SecG [Omnitrophica WOR_2 bacterium RIFCSPLOWO2_02_FULL_63
MLYGLVMVIHILMCLVLIGVVLLQGGRGGLSEALGGAAAQSLFGGGAATVLTKITATCAALFMITSLSLAYLSTARGRSVIEQVPLVSPEGLPEGWPLPVAPTQDAAPQPPEAVVNPSGAEPPVATP